MTYSGHLIKNETEYDESDNYRFIEETVKSEALTHCYVFHPRIIDALRDATEDTVVNIEKFTARYPKNKQKYTFNEVLIILNDGFVHASNNGPRNGLLLRREED